MYLPASPAFNAKDVNLYAELAKAIISLLNAVGTGVIANYISENINKWLSSGSAGKKH